MRGLRFVAGPLVCLLAALAVTEAADRPPPPIPGPKDRCAVCGMFVTFDPKWTTALTFKGGEKAFFDGPKDLFRYYLAVDKYAKGKKQADIEQVYVTEYYSARPLPARDLFFVVGSDVAGPMGRELVPIQGKAQAETFLKDHKGQRLLKFDQVTPDVLSKME